MMTIKPIWLLSVGMAALSAQAHAQDIASPVQDAVQDSSSSSPSASAVPSSEEAEPGEIIVTATRRNEALSNVPIAVSAVTAAMLQNSGANDIRQLNQLAPSLLVSSSGNEANGAARIRGIGTVGDNPGLESSVAIFIDGVYRARTGAGLNELGEIERIEVLRGPQGTLFGRNSTAGLINIISKKPSFDAGGTAEATYGNYDYRRFAGGLTGPIVADKLAYRIDGVYAKRDGFYRNGTPGGGSEDRINNRDRYFVRGQLLFTPSEDLSVRLIGDYTHRKESCCGAVYTSTRETVDPTANSTTPGFNTDGAIVSSATNRIVDILRDPYFASPVRQNGTLDPYNRQVELTPGRTFRNKTEDFGGSGQIDWDLGPGTLSTITAYRQYKAGGAGDVDYNYADLAYRADDGNNYRQFKTFTQEARFQGSLFADRLNFLVGSYYANETLTLVDNLKFGTQYGAFAACRVIATISPLAAFRNPAATGCLTPAGRAAIGGAFGPAGPSVLSGIDRLSTVNNVGDNRAAYVQKSENFALFTHNIIKVTDRLSLTIGARYTHETKRLNADFDNNNTICPVQQAALRPLLANAALAPIVGGIISLTCVGNSSASLNGVKLDSHRSEGEFTGTAVVSWKATDRVLTYASYSKGYKAGGFNLDRSPLGGPNGVLSPRSAADADGLQFAPEKVNAYEIGVKYNSRLFTFNAAAFRQEFKSFQLNTFNGSVFIVQNVNACSTSLNGADTDNSRATGTCAGNYEPGVVAQGVEVETALYPARTVQLTAGYTYADTRYRHNLVGVGEALDPALFLLPGRQVSNAPKNVVTASASWTPDIGGHGFSGLLYVDGRATSKYNTGSDLFPEKSQSGFTVVNARIGLRGPNKDWAIEFWGQNIFNVNYEQVGFSTPFQGSGSSAQTATFGTTANQLFSAYLAEPRTFGATVRTKF